MPRQSRRWVYLIASVLALGIAAALYHLIDGVRAGERLRWDNPWAFTLLAGPALVLWVTQYLRVARAPSFWFSRVPDLQRAGSGWVSRLSGLPGGLRVLSLVLIAFALARPQTFRQEVRRIEGIDIMMVLDLSKSMEEQDLRRNRLDAGQRTIREFLRKRHGLGDRIGLVVFAREAMLQCPLTLDYRTLEWIVASLEIGDVPELGTAIGDALGLALASLLRSEGASKVVILVSDGDSNRAEFMDPLEAKELAREKGIRIFTVLMGQEDSGTRLTKGFTRQQYAVNPALLRQIAKDTGGRYFNAGNDDELEKSFAAIRETLTRTEAVTVGVTPDREVFPFFLLPALLLLAFELLMRMTRWRIFP